MYVEKVVTGTNPRRQQQGRCWIGQASNQHATRTSIMPALIDLLLLESMSGRLPDVTRRADPNSSPLSMTAPNAPEDGMPGVGPVTGTPYMVVRPCLGSDPNCGQSQGRSTVVEHEVGAMTVEVCVQLTTDGQRKQKGGVLFHLEHTVAAGDSGSAVTQCLWRR